MLLHQVVLLPLLALLVHLEHQEVIILVLVVDHKKHFQDLLVMAVQV